MFSFSHFLRFRKAPAPFLVASGGILTASYVSQRTFMEQQPQAQQQPSGEQQKFQIESDLMQRIAQKPYLQAFTSNEQHPRGVPHRLRVLAIDVPEMRTSFDGECRINLSKIYADGIAPPKVIDDKVEVSQKSLIKSLIKCRKHKRIGVELMEASVENLNPHNMRRTHQFGNLLKYDPGKYATRRVGKSVTSEDGDNGITNNADEVEPPKNESAGGETTRKDAEDGTSILATKDDEFDAPWNQYAWIEEMQLRINGKVPFGSTLNASSRFSRILYGNVYTTMVPSSRAFWEWFLPPILHRDPAGKEGNRNSWASNKPHAVIADGAAMQRVPGSVRFLQKTCQEADVPLFIVNDPRVWGGNTHQDLNDALKDMRKTVKYKIVQETMRGSRFARGRLLGQLETEAKWQAKDMGRRTREAVKDANRRLQQELADDWSALGADALQEKLALHKVVDIRKAKNGESVLPHSFSEGMIELFRRYVASSVVTQVAKNDEMPPSEVQSARPDAPAGAKVEAI